MVARGVDSGQSSATGVKAMFDRRWHRAVWMQGGPIDASMKALVCLALAAILGLVACSDAGGDPAATEAGRAAVADVPDGAVRVQSCEPRSLVPASVTTRCGEQVVAALFSRLVELHPATGAASWGLPGDRSLARQISSLDGQRWVINLEPNWQFHDGEPVTAQSFVDAWNDAALGTNARPTAFLFRDIVGFDDLQCRTAACEPRAQEMRGLRAVGTNTLVVTLRAPRRDFPRRLGHHAFSPLPSAAFENPEAFREQPMGNGPFRMEGAWQHDALIRLVRFDDFPGKPALPGTVELDLRRLEDAVAALGRGELDIVTDVPTDRPVPLPDGVRRRTAAGDEYTFLVAPAHLPQLRDPRLVRALSMAIDRPAIIRDHLQGAARPATGLVPPVASNPVDRCGAGCDLDVEAARKEARAADVPDGGIELWFDRSTSEGWVGAIAEQWRLALGDELGPVRVRGLPHEQFVAHLEDRRIGGLYVLGWSMDVPSPDEYLTELHGSGGLFNLDGYWQPDVDELLEAARSAGPSEDLARWFEAERAIIEDWHHIPLWVATHEVLHGDRVVGLTIDGYGRVRLADLVVRE